MVAGLSPNLWGSRLRQICVAVGIWAFDTRKEDAPIQHAPLGGYNERFCGCSLGIQPA